MKATIDALAEMYDIVVIDCHDARLADASLDAARRWRALVARRGNRRSALEETVAAVRAGRKPLLGVVLNGSDKAPLPLQVRLRVRLHRRSPVTGV
jgi:anti-sigma-K factor RskA